MELVCEIIPLSECKLLLFAGHNRLGQSALTAPGYKPAGEGWDSCPSVSFDAHGHETGWLWTRKLAREGDRLVPVNHEADEDTRPVPVNIVA